MIKPHRANMLHGVLFIALFSLAAFKISEFSFFSETLRLSPLIIGIILGLIYANTLRHHLPEEWVPGIKFSAKTILRASIILFGFRLTLSNIIQVGWSGLVIDILMVSSVILLGLLLGKILGLDRDTTILTSAGSAICGAAAVLGTEPVLKAEPSKTVIAVSTVVIFGTLSMFIYPTLYSLGIFHLSATDMGIYTGSTLHEVAHVAGAGAALDKVKPVTETVSIAGLATITKMIRVILLAPFLLILSLFIKGKNREGKRRKISIPWFAIWFLIVILINTLLTSQALRLNYIGEYSSIINVINNIDTFGLTMAMTALGTEASFAKFREAGAKPFILALLLFCWLMGFGYLLITTIPSLFA